jgi:molybdopterin-containing oxidoreductase family iron-sulfur binding subunit
MSDETEDIGRFEGRRHWRSLEELADSPQLRDLLEREFPEQASEWDDPAGRRQFLQLMGASLGLAGLASCAEPLGEKIVPFVKQPEDLIPGKPLRYATAIRLAASTLPVLVTSTMGRPIKIEGNPEHPDSQGATDVFTQASLLTLYDPDRSKTVTNLGGIRPYSDLLGVIRDAAQAQKGTRGAGLRILTGAVTSPTLASQIADLLRTFPEAKWHRYEPVDDENVLAGARMAFGEAVEEHLHLDRADIILSLDADFLGGGVGRVRHAKDFARRRRAPEEGEADRGSRSNVMNRLYVAESMVTLTGAMADHRFRLRSGDVAALARAVAAGLGVLGVSRPADVPRLSEADLAASLGVPGAKRPASVPGISETALAAVIQDLVKHRSRSLVVAGPAQPAEVHALVHAMNHALGNVGTTVTYHAPLDAGAGVAASFPELANDMGAGRVQLLMILGGNPVYTAPVDISFGDLLDKVGLTIHLGLYDDETSARCHWHVPEAHDLESWSDARCPDGSVTLLQPLIEPLYHGKTAHELLAAFTDQPLRPSAEIVKEFWSRHLPGPQFEPQWRRALHDGVVAGTALPPVTVKLQGGPGAAAQESDATAAGELELVFRPDPSVYDGRFANNGWLQELPRPLTRLTWDNAALISPATAERLGFHSEDLVVLNLGGRQVRAPLWILPGHADDSVTVHLGYGRERVGRVGRRTGFNAYAVRNSSARWIAPGARIEATGKRYPLATTQNHGSMEGRPLARHATLSHYLQHPDFAQEMEEAPPAGLTMNPPVKYEGHAWAMAIDLNACTGCNACTIACQAENNIPIVGKEQVKVNREMHWIRVDRYFEGEPDAPAVFHQPVPCMHCEDAPCEQVCPVAATVHSSEGLNDMVYNRCVGTKYCANNCPYKVRRFNFFQYSDYSSPTARLLFNPNVTVRTRGVMEKCTYCVQRINGVRNEAEVEGRPIRDGEILTACQQVCPSDAIVFGDLNDPNSRVVRWKAQPRNYSLLGNLNTRPRTTYLAALKNPNPEISRDEA